VTFIGVARADGAVVTPDATAGDGTPIYVRPVPQGFFLVVEAKPGPNNRAVGQTTVSDDADELPNLQVVVSRPLGNGSADVCDDRPPLLGGVPAVDPPRFDASTAPAINDLGCRFNARTLASSPTSIGPCTRNASGDYVFVNSGSRVQFCPSAGIDTAIAFPTGDTRVTVRVSDVFGQPGATAAIIIRVP
jgi:hypothetical protein